MFSSQNSNQNKASYNAQFPLIMTPGPVLVPDAIMKALALPVIHHRTLAFESDLKWILENLPKIFKTTQPAYILTSTGSGAMEAALVNTVSPGEKVLCIIGGKFGERFSEIAKAYSMEVIIHNVEWGKSFDVSEITKILTENPDIKAVTCQACETSTGALNPVKELGEVVSKTNALLIVDAITALGATDLDMDKWKLDIVIGGSQKAFMLPTGLSLIAFSKRAMERTASCKTPRYYWDIRLEKKANEKNQTFFSSPVTHIRALKVALQIILKIGQDNFIERHKLIGEAIREAGSALGLKSYATIPSSTITAFLLPKGLDGEKVQKIMQEKHGISIAGGQDKLKGKIIRIGHMGAIEKTHLLFTIEKLALTFEELGIKVDKEKALTILHDKLKNLEPLPPIDV